MGNPPWPHRRALGSPEHISPSFLPAGLSKPGSEDVEIKSFSIVTLEKGIKALRTT